MNEIKPGTRVRIKGTDCVYEVREVCAHTTCVEFDPHYPDGTVYGWFPNDILESIAPEPPERSYVLLSRYYGVYEHAERGWIDANQATGPAYEWDALLRLNSGDAPVRLYRADEQPLRRAAKELRDNGPTVPKFYPDYRERVVNWLDSLADLYEGGRDDR